MPSPNDYKYYTPDELAAKIVQYDAGIADIMGGSQSYSLDGQSFTRAQLPYLQDSVNAMRAARAKQTGQGATIAQPIVQRFGTSPTRRY